MVYEKSQRVKQKPSSWRHINLPMRFPWARNQNHRLPTSGTRVYESRRVILVALSSKLGKCIVKQSTIR